MKKRNVCMLLAAALSCSLLLTACGGGGTSTTTPGTSTPSTSTSAPAGSGGASTGAESGYTFRTSESNRVVTENGTFTKGSLYLIIKGRQTMRLAALVRGKERDASILSIREMGWALKQTIDRLDGAEEAEG